MVSGAEGVSGGEGGKGADGSSAMGQLMSRISDSLSLVATILVGLPRLSERVIDMPVPRENLECA